MPQCAICLGTDAPDVPHDRYVDLPCGHYSPNNPDDCFHLSCLAQTFETQSHEGGQPSCPICRERLSPAAFQALVTLFTEDRQEGLPCSLDAETDIPELISWLDAEAQSLAEQGNAGGNNAPAGGGGANPDGGEDDQNDDGGDDAGGEGEPSGEGSGGDPSGGGYEPPGDQEQGDNNWGDGGGGGGGGEGYR